MQARSALFDLYGDYLRPRGGRAPVAALVRLLAPLGIAAPAVRTAVSRMVRQGWLHPQRLSTGPGYQLTPKAARRELYANLDWVDRLGSVNLQVNYGVNDFRYDILWQPKKK